MSEQPESAALAAAELHLATCEAPAGNGTSERPEVPSPLDSATLAPACALLATLASAWIAERHGAHWMVTPERAERIGNALARVVLKYVPSLGTYGPEAELGIALGDWALAGLAPLLAREASAMHVDAAAGGVAP